MRRTHLPYSSCSALWREAQHRARWLTLRPCSTTCSWRRPPTIRARSTPSTTNHAISTTRCTTSCIIRQGTGSLLLILHERLPRKSRVPRRRAQSFWYPVFYVEGHSIKDNGIPSHLGSSGILSSRGERVHCLRGEQISNDNMPLYHPWLSEYWLAWVPAEFSFFWKAIVMSARLSHWPTSFGFSSWWDTDSCDSRDKLILCLIT